MVSATQQTRKIRGRKRHKRALAHRNALKRRPTPAFPIHPEGAQSTAARTEQD